MGIDVHLTDEFGAMIEAIGDPMGLLLPLLPQEDDPAYPLLESIDPYGNTVFNRTQMKRFLQEWRYVVSQAQSAKARDLIEAVERMASRCQREPHTYLTFIGD